MASKISLINTQAIKTLGKFIKPSLFDKGTGALLPEAYRKFYKEWKEMKPTAVHYVPEEGKWKRDELSGFVSPVENHPLPVIDPAEAHAHLWGGESVVQGFKKKDPLKRRTPHFWIPVLKRSVVYSEVLNKYFSVVVTDRTIHLINSNFGFDHYLLKTPACDLKALMPLGVKRRILQDLENHCPAYKDQPERQNKVYEKYKQYLSAYTPEEIEWYGYSFTAACKRLESQLEEQNRLVPLKNVYRYQLIKKLQEAELQEQRANLQIEESGSWLQKMNPFAKKRET